MRRIALITIICAFVAAPASADLVDPDAFAVGTDISNAFAGVTLSSIGAGFDGVIDSRIFAINPNGGYPEPFSASTGSLVFGTSDNTFPHLFGGWGGEQLRVDFSIGATLVSLDAIGNNGSDFGSLQAYDAGGTLVDSYSTGQLTLSSFEAMTVSGSNIAYVIASGVGGDSLGFDNLDFNPVPVPGAFLLGMLGLSVAGLKLRKRA